MKRSLANSLIFFVILSLFHQKLNSEILPFNDKYYSFTAKFSYFEDERSNFEPDIVSDFWIPQNKKHQAIFQSRVDFSLDLFLSSHFSFSFKLPLILKRSRIIFDDFALSDQKKIPGLRKDYETLGIGESEFSMGFFAYKGESFAFALNLGFIFAGHDGPEGANLATEVPLAKGHHAILAGASFFLGNPKFLGSLKYTLNYYLGGVTSYVTKYIPPAPGQPPSPLIATNGSFHPYQIHKLNIKFSLKVLTDLAFNFYFRQKWLQLPYLYEKGQVFSYHYRDYLDYSSLGISVKYSFNENFGLELGYFLKVVDSKKDDPFFAIDSADEGPSISFIGYVF